MKPKRYFVLWHTDQDAAVLTEVVIPENQDPKNMALVDWLYLAAYTEWQDTNPEEGEVFYDPTLDPFSVEFVFGAVDIEFYA